MSVDNIDILWVLSGGFGLMLVMWHFLNSHMERQDKKLESIEKDLQQINTKRNITDIIGHSLGKTKSFKKDYPTNKNSFIIIHRCFLFL